MSMRDFLAGWAVMGTFGLLAPCHAQVSLLEPVVVPQSALTLALEAQQYAQGIANAAATEADPAIATERAARAIGAARHSLELDNSSATAFAALGLAYRQIWQSTLSIEAFEQALALDPLDANHAFNVSWLRAFRGEFERATEVAEASVALNPARASAHRDLGIVLAYARNPQAALAELQRCIELDPTIGVCHIYSGFMYHRLGNNGSAEAALREAERLFGDGMSPAAASSLAHAYARVGRTSDARRLYDRLLAMSVERVVGLGTWPLAYLAIGDRAQALEALTRAVEKGERGEPDEGYFNMMIIKANVQNNPVLEEARFVALRERIGGK
jgi:tetratricopeptide (TPR) repeat protein